MNRLHHQAGPRDLDGEAPMNACQALAAALAAVRDGSAGATAHDMGDAAYILVDLRASGWDVTKGRSTQLGDAAAAMLCVVRAKVLGKEITPVMRVEAERAIGALRDLGFDMVRAGALA